MSFVGTDKLAEVKKEDPMTLLKNVKQGKQMVPAEDYAKIMKKLIPDSLDESQKELVRTMLGIKSKGAVASITSLEPESESAKAKTPRISYTEFSEKVMKNEMPFMFKGSIYGIVVYLDKDHMAHNKKQAEIVIRQMLKEATSSSTVKVFSGATAYALTPDSILVSVVLHVAFKCD